MKSISRRSGVIYDRDIFLLTGIKKTYIDTVQSPRQCTHPISTSYYYRFNNIYCPDTLGIASGFVFSSQSKTFYWKNLDNCFLDSLDYANCIQNLAEIEPI